jgi:hypothetical protein
MKGQIERTIDEFVAAVAHHFGSEMHVIASQWRQAVLSNSTDAVAAFGKQLQEGILSSPYNQNKPSGSITVGPIRKRVIFECSVTDGEVVTAFQGDSFQELFMRRHEMYRYAVDPGNDDQKFMNEFPMDTTVWICQDTQLTEAVVRGYKLMLRAGIKGKPVLCWHVVLQLLDRSPVAVAGGDMQPTVIHLPIEEYSETYRIGHTIQELTGHDTQLTKLMLGQPLAMKTEVKTFADLMSRLGLEETVQPELSPFPDFTAYVTRLNSDCFSLQVQVQVGNEPNPRRSELVNIETDDIGYAAYQVYDLTNKIGQELRDYQPMTDDEYNAMVDFAQRQAAKREAAQPQTGPQEIPSINPPNPQDLIYKLSQLAQPRQPYVVNPVIGIDPGIPGVPPKQIMIQRVGVLDANGQVKGYSTQFVGLDQPIEDSELNQDNITSSDFLG